MPYLPLNLPDPYGIVMSRMLFPNEEDVEAAAMQAGNILQGGLKCAIRDGVAVSPKLLLRATAYAGQVENLEATWKEAFWAGDLTAYLHEMWIRDQKLASWEKAAELLTKHKAVAKKSGSRSAFMAAKSRFYPVLHLWGAYAIRGWHIGGDPAKNYTDFADFEAFLSEAEVLLEWLEGCIFVKGHSPDRMWRIPEWWVPEPRMPRWPALRRICRLDLPKLDEVLFAGVQKKLDT